MMFLFFVASNCSMKLRMTLDSWEVKQTSDTDFSFDRLLLFDKEHLDPVALTEILLETCSSITHSLGKWTFPDLWLMMNCLSIGG